MMLLGRGGDDTVLMRNTAWVLAGQAARLAIQAVYFVVIARALGASQYGAFVGVVAAVAVWVPFSGTGYAKLMVKNVARDSSLFAECFGNALIMVGLSGLVALSILLACAGVILPGHTPTATVILVGCADLLALRVVEVAGQAFMAVDRLGCTARIDVASSLSKCLAAVLLVVWQPHPSAGQWAMAYFISAAAIASAAVLWVVQQLGRPKADLHRLKKEYGESLYFSLGQSSQSIYNDVDKIMLARLTSVEAAGIYGAAYRLVDIACVPFKALLAAAFPGCFRAGSRGLSGAIEYMRRLIPRALAYASLASLGLFFTAPLVPQILGSEYVHTVEAIRWLAALPLLRAAHCFLADALTGAGYQGVRSAIQVAIAVANVALNAWIIRAYSWKGAAWSSLFCDLLLAIIMGAVLYAEARRSPRTITIVPAITSHTA